MLDGKGTVEYANTTAAAMLGRPREDVAGKAFATFLPADERRRFRSALADVARAAPARTRLHLGGERRELVAALRLVDPGSGTVALALRDEALDARTLHDFVRNAAHQLRTPLAGIASAVQVLQSGAKEDPADRDRFLAHVERHVDRLTRIGRGLLVLARAQAGDAMRLDFVELLPLLDDLAAEVTPPKGVTIRVECPPGLAAFCEPDLTHEAIAALLDNAVEHTKEGPIALVAWAQGDRVSVAVRDSGPGVPAEHAPRIFEPFYQPAGGRGFGLGLAIADQAVRAMNGSIRLETRERGAGFRIELPSARVVP